MADLDGRLCVCGHPAFVHANRENMPPAVAEALSAVCISCPATLPDGCPEFREHQPEPDSWDDGDCGADCRWCEGDAR